MPTKRKKEASD